MKLFDYLEQAMFATPPGATVGLYFCGVSVQSWAALLSILMLVVQFIYFIKNQRRKDREYEERGRSSGNGSGTGRGV